ncbi:TLC domain-containing protein 5-like [Diabrotica virgifera virgifera]|uniref:TLC domain-containing protein n=1 Tax=Diabrotica virgifera virgifera TaxID=50390 RepID=A0ABM5ICZ0_DIAVI|nr:TLC domain-containing protein 5-like [Diabrotica virgifera virgifera]
MLERFLFRDGYLDFETPVAVAFFAGLCRFLYLLVSKIIPTKSPEYHCRVISFIHGFITAFVGINQCFLVDNPFYHPYWRTTYTQSILLAFSAGYFIHDLIWMLEHTRDERVFIAHHFYSAFTLVRILFKGTSGAQASCSLGILEITNPFLQMRWFLSSEGKDDTALFTSIEIMFFSVFLVIRIMVGGYLLKIVLTHPQNDWEFKFMSLSMYILSWVFFVNILQYIFGKFKDPNKDNT